MFPAKFLKRPMPRYSQGLFLVVPLIQDLILQVDADGKSVLFQEATINQTLVFTFCNKFGCPILSLIVRNSSAYFTTGFMYRLYSRLQEIYNIASGFLSDQICDALNYGLSLQPLNNQFKFVRFI